MRLWSRLIETLLVWRTSSPSPAKCPVGVPFLHSDSAGEGLVGIGLGTGLQAGVTSPDVVFIVDEFQVNFDSELFPHGACLFMAYPSWTNLVVLIFQARRARCDANSSHCAAANRRAGWDTSTAPAGRLLVARRLNLDLHTPTPANAVPSHCMLGGLRHAQPPRAPPQGGPFRRGCGTIRCNLEPTSFHMFRDLGSGWYFAAVCATSLRTFCWFSSSTLLCRQ